MVTRGRREASLFPAPHPAGPADQAPEPSPCRAGGASAEPSASLCCFFPSHLAASALSPLPRSLSLLLTQPFLLSQGPGVWGVFLLLVGGQFEGSEHPLLLCLLEWPWGVAGVAWVWPEDQGSTVVSAGLETGPGRDAQPPGAPGPGWAVISCRLGEGSVKSPKSPPWGPKY